jgi:glycosyltransferase involved in cell wall biosynthesis
MTQHLSQQHDDRFVAIHSYMAEPFLSAFRPQERPPLYLDYVVSEAAVLRGGRTLKAFRRLEAGRTWRDEVRCCLAADATGGFDQAELDLLSEAGVPAPTFLRISFPPADKVDVTTAQNLLFLGDRTWHPNFDGLTRLCRRWPEIHRAVPGARLLVVGTGPIPREVSQPGIDVLGFLPSLDPVWRDVRALVAPLVVGGGVRVKVLEAAARGVPVIASDAASGSLPSYLGFQSVHSEEELVETSVALLSDHARSVREGNDLYESNALWWSKGAFRRDVATWLGLAEAQE